MSLRELLRDVFGGSDVPEQRGRASSAPIPQAPLTPPAVPGAPHSPAFATDGTPAAAGGRNWSALLLASAVGLGSLLSSVLLVYASVSGAKLRLAEPDAESKPAIAIAQEAEVAYCTREFKAVLERVLHSCGLSSSNERRGCKPADIKTFAAISDEDFNALFHPLEDRGGVLMFDVGSEELDAQAKKLLEERWVDRKGARYFFVVARASKTGTPDKNRALSHRRANSVMFHLEASSGESKEELSKKVGLLWLGNEFAQLSDEYCSWPRSRTDAECGQEPINRSAFVSWVDCRL